ncbi:polar amino acid transport system permease protein [Devosia enhydra]|uniref:Glutamate/aspartate import permease protein GltK n=1 Tax=Devosia enhydra TaxID=665118 RepID=A0A1K2HYK1_9HYPH|nr:amino acid ABC transporter permease [Devosia enhydra]SFZ84692.1 polar amino acid transport system permease protein [Devosia enhydra]
MAIATDMGGAARRPLPADDASLAIRRDRIGRIVVGALVFGLLAWLVLAAAANPRFEWDVVARYFTAQAVMNGLMTTLYLTLVIFVFSLVIGTLLALARESAYRPFQILAWVYSWVFRSVPALVQLIFWFNLAYIIPSISLGLPFGPTLFEARVNDLISPFLAAVLGLGLGEAAYKSEIIRAGLMSVDKGQREAARAIGLTGPQTFFRIVIPQSMRFILPPLGNQTILNLKGTSLVSVIALSDLLHSVQSIYNRTLEVVPLLMVATLWYLIIVSIMSVIQIGIERHFSRGHGASRAIKAVEGRIEA